MEFCLVDWGKVSKFGVGKSYGDLFGGGEE